MGYPFVRRLSWLLVNLFYRRIEVAGLEQLPASGPVLVVANHHNALIDPMLLLATLPRRLRPLAKAPLFRHPVIGPFLRLAGAVPVHRRQDPGSDPTGNIAMFQAALATFRAGGAVLIFPEGVSQPEPALMPLRTGAARMVLDAHAAERVALVPVGLVFHEPGTLRAGWALVLVGAPIPTEDCAALARTKPHAAVGRLTDRMAHALRQLMVEAGDRQTRRLLGILDALWREETPGSTADAAARAEWMQRVMRAHRFLGPREAGRLERFRGEVARYAKDLELAGVTGRQLSRSYAAGAVARYAVREGGSLLLGLPLALWGIVNHVIPYQLTRLVVYWLGPSPDSEATYKISAAVVLYPFCWIGEGALIWQLGGPWAVAAFAVSLAPTGVFALSWQDRLQRFGRETRGFLQFLGNRSLRDRLKARRRALMDELTALARLVPESVLADRPDE